MIGPAPALSKVGARNRRSWGLPACVLVLYGVLYLVSPDKTVLALTSSVRVALSLVMPFAFVVAVLFLVNLLVRPSQVAKLLEGSAEWKALLLSLAAGILSVGPVLAWYPLLKRMKEEGAGDAPMAVFLYSRAVKPILLPVMIGYFGWWYALILSVLIIIGSIVLGYGMRARNR